MGWSYQTVTRDVSEINMAAGKINTNKDHQAAEMIQRWFSKSFCQVEWQYFVRRLFLEGKIPGKSIIDYNADAWRYNQCQWRAPGWDFIDPYRESQAVVALRENNLITLEEYYGNKGVDWRIAIEQLSVEQKYLREYGLEIAQAKPVAPGADVNASEGNDAADNAR